MNGSEEKENDQPNIIPKSVVKMEHFYDLHDNFKKPKGKHMEFQHLWLGPFQVEEKIGQGTYRLKTLQRETKNSLLMANILRDTSSCHHMAVTS